MLAQVGAAHLLWSAVRTGRAASGRPGHLYMTATHMSTRLHDANRKQMAALGILGH